MNVQDILKAVEYFSVIERKLTDTELDLYYRNLLLKTDGLDFVKSKLDDIMAQRYARN